MPVPLPDAGSVLLQPPSDEETRETARGVASAVARDGRLTDLQRVLLEALFRSMTGTSVDLADFEPMSSPALAEHLARRNLQFRSRGVQVMLLAALVLRPLPEEVVDRVSEYARELGVDDAMITVARGFAAGSLGLASIDFERNGYTAHWHPADADVLHTSTELADAWQTAVTDPGLAARWRALEQLPDGTLGGLVSKMYRARGFEYPGLPGSAPPLLAQHDWVHVLADYGTTVESELEVFGLIARANDDMYAFSLLAMVVSLFETGYLRSGAGLFEYNVGHISADPRVATRIADAMRRGALCRDGRTGSDSVDFLRVDWFDLAAMALEDARALFRITPKSSEARAVGSTGPWERGGISEYQLRQGAVAAERRGVRYDSFGAA
ncbi:MAG: hypothetical protein ACYDH6_16710 [Acidimicrobiales bacterium]